MRTLIIIRDGGGFQNGDTLENTVSFTPKIPRDNLRPPASIVLFLFTTLMAEKIILPITPFCIQARDQKMDHNSMNTMYFHHLAPFPPAPPPFSVIDSLLHPPQLRTILRIELPIFSSIPSTNDNRTLGTNGTPS